MNSDYRCKLSRVSAAFLCVLLICSMAGCGQNHKAEALPQANETTATSTTAEVSEEESTETPAFLTTPIEENNSEKAEDTEMKLYFNETEIPVIWEKCPTVDELKEEAEKGDIIINMSMYGGWEQVGSLGKTYTSNDKQMTAVSGDIVLYCGNQIVVFYGSNSWSYTKLGKMTLPEDELETLLSNENITLTIRNQR